MWMITWSLLFVGIIFWYSVPGSSLFSWHPFCMVTAFQLLMFQGIATFSPNELFFVQGAKRNYKVFIHWIFQCFAITFAVGGFLSIYFNKERLGKSHFTSWHGIFGLITCLLSISISIGGLFAKYPKWVKNFFTISSIRRLHAIFGTLLFGISAVTLVLGLLSSWSINTMPFPLPYILMLSICISACVVVQQVYNSRIKTMFKS